MTVGSRRHILCKNRHRGIETKSEDDSLKSWRLDTASSYAVLFAKKPAYPGDRHSSDRLFARPAHGGRGTLAGSHRNIMHKDNPDQKNDAEG
jgi:hypothetical protein